MIIFKCIYADNDAWKKIVDETDPDNRLDLNEHIDKVTSVLKNFNGKFDYYESRIEFETEEGMTLFLLRYS